MLNQVLEGVYAAMFLVGFCLPICLVAFVIGLIINRISK